MPSSPADMMAAMLNNLQEKTGNTLDHWLNVVGKSGEEKHNTIIKFLKTNHGLTHGYANLIAFKFRGQFEESKSGTDLIRDQFKGDKQALLTWFKNLRNFNSVPRKICGAGAPKILCFITFHQS